MYLEPIIALLVAGNAGVVGQTLFQQFMPGTITQGLVVLNPNLAARINWEIGDSYRKDDPFQIIARSTSYLTARSLAINATSILLSLSDLTLPATANSPQLNTKYIRPIHDPIVYPRQGDNLWEASVNFQTTYCIQN